MKIEHVLVMCLAGCGATARPARGPLEELTAFSRSQDPAQLDRALDALVEGEAVERAFAAFALGQLGVAWDPADEPTRAQAERALTVQLAKEKDRVVRDRIVEALGKVAQDPQPLIASLNGAERTRAALGLGLLVKNGRLKPPLAVAELIKLLDDSDAEARWAAAWALSRMKAPESGPPLTAHLKDPSWLVRANAARALGDLDAGGDDELAKTIDDPDERVAAEAGGALAKRAARCEGAGDCRALSGLGSTGKWRWPVAAAIAAQPITHPAAVDLFAGRAGNECLLAMAHDRALGRVDLLDHCYGDERRRAVLAARALGEAKTEEKPRRKALEALFQDKHGSVRAAAAESMGKLDSHAVDELLAQRLAEEEDPEVVAAIAGAIDEHKVSGVELTLYGRATRLEGPETVEARQALITAIGGIGMREAVPLLLGITHNSVGAIRTAARQALRALNVTPPARTIPPVELAGPQPERKVRLRTGRGDVVVLLWGADAPRTVENFLKLVRSHFYDGLTFHRVVPDFVAQGGDPHGSGSGGPGWAIDCEINQRRYGEGTLGMALSGQDTGGSQFFITLSPQPHLDGRYTAFGQVVEGMAAVRALEEGDKILDARPEK